MIVSSAKDKAQSKFGQISALTTTPDPNEGVNLVLDTNDATKLRPQLLEEYIGQEKVVSQLKLIIHSAKLREVLPEHMLFYGPPGLGKTTLANLVAKELGCTIKTVTAASLQKVGDLVSLLVNLEARTVLFIDEIHRLKAPLEETLYGAMEDRKIDILVGKGQGANTLKLDLEPFVLIGATTQVGKLSKPLRDRFINVFRLDTYSETDMLTLVDRNAQLLRLNLTDEAKLLICRRSRGVPRIANNILKRILDWQTVHQLTTVDVTEVEEFLSKLGIYDKGLTKTDLMYLRSLRQGSLSLSSLSAILMEEPETLELVTEPLLLHLGFIEKDSSGRKLTPKGRQFLETFDGDSIMRLL
jgi:Holliday junction DNA helicase RuvB